MIGLRFSSSPHYQNQTTNFDPLPLHHHRHHHLIIMILFHVFLRLWFSYSRINIFENIIGFQILRTNSEPTNQPTNIKLAYKTDKIQHFSLSPYYPSCLLCFFTRRQSRSRNYYKNIFGLIFHISPF